MLKERAKKALEEMLNWSGNSEIDLYPYVREVVTNVFDYPRDHIRLAEKGTQGRIPDVSLVSADVSPKNKVYWIVAEVKREQKAFRSKAYRRERWDNLQHGAIVHLEEVIEAMKSFRHI